MEPNQLAVIPTWSELCPDLLRCVFKRLTFTNLERAKLVCRWWYSSSRGCVPKRNQIPWLILFPSKVETNRCVLFVPDDKDKVYKTRDLGPNLAKRNCLATYGSWLLMCDYFSNLYILNPFTLERIDLPSRDPTVVSKLACLWIDETTKDYLVVWAMFNHMVFTKKGDDTWRRNLQPTPFGQYYQILYNHKDHKVYTFVDFRGVFVWDFSSDIPSALGYLPSIDLTPDQYVSDYKRCIALTVSGQVLYVRCVRVLVLWEFYIYKFNPQMQKWENVDSLGDEALILDIGYTVVAKDTTGIKRNSIYFKSYIDHIFVYDLTTQMMERLPDRVFSSMPASEAQWFFPGLIG